VSDRPLRHPRGQHPRQPTWILPRVALWVRNPGAFGAAVEWVAGKGKSQPGGGRRENGSY